MSAGITRCQRDALWVIQELTGPDGIPPSYAEIQIEMGLRSRSAVNRLVWQLVERGWISCLPAQARSIAVLRTAPPPEEPEIVGLFEDARLASAAMEGAQP